MTETTSPIQALLDRLHGRHLADRSGEVAAYIPELARAEPDLFGIAMVTADGTVYESGDTRHEFTIQSISKPLTYALALEAVGEEEVRRHVDVEPSGEAFNSITLEADSGIPLNPMVNAGAITTASLIEPLGFEFPIDRILHEYSAFAGRDLVIDEDVYESERDTGYRNRAIAWLLRNSGAISNGDVEGVLETYFQQCSVLVDCRDLAVIAATLAASGVNPLSRERVLREDTVQNVLSVMASCGMYDSAGDWLYTVGLPAKSGVAGGVIAVLPGQIGIAVFSPRLDAHGNSVRGIAVCEDLSGKLGLHVMSPVRRPPPPIRRERTLVECRSKRMRPRSGQATLAEHGWRARALELQGQITFAAGELVTGAALAGISQLEYGILDFAAVRSVDEIDIPIFSHLAENYTAEDAELVFSSVDGLPEFTAALTSHRSARELPPIRTFPDLDAALEWCEQGLIERYGDLDSEERELGLAQHGATIGMSPDQIQLLAGLVERRIYPAGSTIYDTSDADVNEMLLVTRGTISTFVAGPDGAPRRVATLIPGMSLGEVGMIDGTRRIGSSRADTEVAAFVLDREGLAEMRDTDPDLAATFYENLIRMLAIRAGNLQSSL